jgi:hypothetical protein
MLRFHEGRTRDDPELDAKRAWRPITPGLRSWRSQLGREDLVRFEAAAGELLEELGYERSTSSPPRALAHAKRIREVFANEVRDRRRPLPGTWTFDAVAGVP